METTAWSMLHSLWIGALLYGLLQLGLLIVGPQRAALRSVLAYVALSGMFAGFVLVFSNNFRLAAILELDVTTGPLPQDMFPLSKPETRQQISEILRPYFPFLVSGYAAGLLFQWVILTLGLFRIRGLQHSGLSAVPDSWQKLFESAPVCMGISRKVGFFLSARVTSPIVIGFLKPMVLIPVAIINHLDLQQAELILLHELAHVRRQDYLLNLLKSFIEAFLFFNPFVWLCGRIIQAERENACDDLVIGISSRTVDYAHTLFRVAAHSVRQKPSLALGAAGQHKYHLLQRIKRMTNMKTKQNYFKQPLIAMILAVLVSGSIAWVKPQEKVVKIAPPYLPANKLDTPCDSVPGKDSLIQPPLPPVAPEPPAPIDSVTFIAASDPIIEINITDTIPGDSALHFFKSHVWKKQEKEIDSLKAFFNSSQWKKQMAGINKQAGLASIQVEQARKLADSLRAKFDSPKWKKKIREMTQVYTSPEYKQLLAEFEHKVEALRKRTLKDSGQ
ncbi:BlaR1 peptidase M56 [bacterium A37T11]|nr:BlaR1 peptidase M56 [bacterium A37T11]